MHFLLTNSRHFLSNAAFSGSTGSSTCWNSLLGFPEGAHNRGLSSNPTIYTISPSLDEDWPLMLLVVVHFTCPMISSISSHVTICFKNGLFSLCSSTESHAEIWSRRVFSLNLCGTQTSKQLT